jgi:hypothetical protein
MTARETYNVLMNDLGTKTAATVRAAHQGPALSG